MKAKEFYDCKWLTLLNPLYGFEIRAITAYPLIFYKNKRPRQIIKKHEHIHINQVQEDGLMRFCFFYSKEFFQNRLNGMNRKEANRNISYEKEARRKSI